MACRYEARGEGDGLSFRFPATQTHLADMMALTPVHVNRTLKVLRQDGLAQVQSRNVRILDWSGIVEAGEFDPTYLQIARSANDNRSWPQPSVVAR
jgi:DNA-binding transcriptional regulator LsrR (DeoR family)